MPLNEFTRGLKPPIGIKPKNVWLRDRARNIVDAINRRTNAGVSISTEWVKEYNQLVKEIAKLEGNQ